MRDVESGDTSMTRTRRAFVSPLATWFPTDAAIRRFRRTALSREATVLPPRDDAWRRLVPGFERTLAFIDRGLPFHVVAERDHDRSPDPARLRAALHDAATVLVPQAHQVLPRLARLSVALRATLFGPLREECSYLFVVEGRGREAMGLHHDGDTDGVWLQVHGRRTVTLGPPVPRGTPEALASGVPQRGRGWSTIELPPGALFYLPPRTPHRVVCHGRSLAVSLTWGPRVERRHAGRTPLARSRALAEGLTVWDVASGKAEPWPPDATPGTLWTQVPAVAGALHRRRSTFTLRTADDELTLPASMHALASRLAAMPRLDVADLDAAQASLQPLLDAGILADEDVPLVVTPDDPAALDGWRFT
jgi:hypothetical protein